MVYNVIGFLIADKCNFTCQHCCNESHPHGETMLDIDAACRCIDEASAHGGFREVGISGGEPFLFPKQLAQITRHAASRGLSFAVTSNGFWATSPAAAERALGPLHQDGLRCLNLSISPFHLPFTTPEKWQAAAAAAVKLGMVTRVNCVCTRTFGLDDAHQLLGADADAVEFVPMPCIPTGRAAEFVLASELLLAPGIPTGSCAQHFTKLAVTADGEVFPCCSPGGFTPPLKVGDVRHDSVGEIIAGMTENPLIQILRSAGPSFFAPYITRALGPDALHKTYVDQCHLCHAIMTDDATRAVIEGVIAQLVRDMATLHIDIASLADDMPVSSPGPLLMV